MMSRLSWLSFLSILISPPAHAADPPPEFAKRLDHWSFQPLRRPAVPVLKRSLDRRQSPIDQFIVAKLEEKGLSLSAEADRRTLIRRLSFDLTGLPPQPERVDAFLRDPHPQAFERLVEELLASPAYGERWARHWLDVVHFGETHGYDKDQPRPNAWPYRDYVIRALNNDKPYSRFVLEQLAGDVLYPNTRDGMEALGFLSAGPWDFIGHAEVPETKIDGMVARHLDRDDMVGNALGTFMSLTVQCAQCHDHKFDPITQEDYYRLQAVFAAVDRADLTYDLDPAVALRRATLTTQRGRLKTRLDGLEKQVIASSGRKVELLNRLIQEARHGRELPERPEFGYHSAIESTQIVTKWVQVDLGASRDIHGIAYVGCKDGFNNIGDGFGFPLRYKVEVSDDATFTRETTTLVDHTKADVENPGIKPARSEEVRQTGRFVRFTATKLAPRQNDYILALAELQVFDKAGRNIALGAPVTALDAVDVPPRWSPSNLTDGYYPGSLVKKSPEEIVSLEQERDACLARATDRTLIAQRDATRRDLSIVEAEIQALPAAMVVYAGKVHHGSGAFRGTGPDGGKPRTIRVLKRGEVTKPGKEVEPGTVALLTNTQFNLPPNHREGDRRAALAKWMTRSDNPMTWRSIVNRVWQYHFGRGLVDTPNDFGHMGQRPSHPELLDWLAVEFRDSGGSLKELHRLIVNSATYKQSSNDAGPGAVTDVNNTLLWRMNRRKLEAEAVHDATLFIAGRLDPRMGGPSFQDFVVEHPEHSPHYRYDKADPDDPRTHRRSIYRFIVRSQPQPFMATLDCADPSMRVDKRNVSLSPVQALTLLNNGFMLTMARHFAARVEAMEKDLPSRVTAAYRLALSRTPSAEDRDAMVTLAAEHGLANACRVLLNLNEFVFVD